MSGIPRCSAVSEALVGFTTWIAKVRSYPADNLTCVTFTQKNSLPPPHDSCRPILLQLRHQGIGQKLHFFAKNILIFSTAARRGACGLAFCHVIGATVQTSTGLSLRAYGPGARDTDGVLRHPPGLALPAKEVAMTP